MENREEDDFLDWIELESDGFHKKEIQKEYRGMKKQQVDELELYIYDVLKERNWHVRKSNIENVLIITSTDNSKVCIYNTDTNTMASYDNSNLHTNDIKNYKLKSNPMIATKGMDEIMQQVINFLEFEQDEDYENDWRKKRVF